MISRHKVMLADWYSRVVFGVIAVALAMLAFQGAFTVEPVAHAQSERCGSQYNPCYVEIENLESTLLRVEMVGLVRTRPD